MDIHRKKRTSRSWENEHTVLTRRLAAQPQQQCEPTGPTIDQMPWREWVFERFVYEVSSLRSKYRPNEVHFVTNMTLSLDTFASSVNTFDDYEMDLAFELGVDGSIMVRSISQNDQLVAGSRQYRKEEEEKQIRAAALTLTNTSKSILPTHLKTSVIVEADPVTDDLLACFRFVDAKVPEYKKRGLDGKTAYKYVMGSPILLSEICDYHKRLMSKDYSLSLSVENNAFTLVLKARYV
jgi:hypothetical protein